MIRLAQLIQFQTWNVSPVGELSTCYTLRSIRSVRITLLNSIVRGVPWKADSNTGVSKLLVLWNLKVQNVVHKFLILIPLKRKLV
jgi:hypothetical protein